MSDTGNAVLYAKMAAIMGEIDRLPKDKDTKSGPRYKFTSDAAVSDLIRAKLAAHNIAFFAEMLEAKQEPITSGGGAGGYHTVVHLRFTFACGDSGATETREWRGEANDYGDKGINKGSTLGEKFFLLKTFVMSTGDPDDDPDSGNQPMKHNPKRQAKPKPPTVDAPETHDPEYERGVDEDTDGTAFEWATDERTFTSEICAELKLAMVNTNVSDHPNHAAAIILQAMNEAHGADGWGAIYNAFTVNAVYRAVAANRAAKAQEG